jgi:hypothetical protein
MTKIDHKIHKPVKLEYLPNVESRYWGEGETIEKFIEYFTYLQKVAEDAGAVITSVNVHTCDGYSKCIEAWIPKTSEELERDRISAEAANSLTEERELKELKRLKEKYDGITYALSSL